ncbi:MAG: hypothetical protein ABIA04_11330 [Pseudomonadota bacterium]
MILIQDNKIDNMYVLKFISFDEAKNTLSRLHVFLNKKKKGKIYSDKEIRILLDGKYDSLGNFESFTSAAMAEFFNEILELNYWTLLSLEEKIFLSEILKQHLVYWKNGKFASTNTFIISAVEDIKDLGQIQYKKEQEIVFEY